jgi:hypothetical protein
MGQRLNVEIISKSKTIANVYMHWSAYTDSSFEIAIRVLESFLNINNKFLNNKQTIYTRLQKALPGASITQSEYDALVKEGVKGIYVEKYVDRNNGLISFTEKGIADTRDWEEGRVSIDIENKKILFDVYWTDNIEDYKEDYDASDEDVLNIPKVEKNPFLEWLSLEDFRNIKQWLYYDKIRTDTEIIHWIR